MQNHCLIRLSGDVMIGRSVNEKISQKGYTYPWGNVLPYLKKPGVNVINLEAAITDSKEEVPKVFNFKADPDKVKTLSEAHIHIANIANNHILDYSKQGLEDTIRMLDSVGIQHAGAGRSLAEARKPALIECNGIRIGLIGCTDNEPDWKANSGPGTNHVETTDNRELEKDIKSIRHMVDILILSAHLGANMIKKPDPEKIEFAHKMIDIGVDIFHGHSAHIFQAIEVYKNRVIIYDAGDFIDDYVIDRELRNDRSFLYEIEIKGRNISGFRLIPVIIHMWQVNFAKDADKEWAIARMQYLSADFGTRITDAGEVKL